jgi:hypothetical protein
MTYYKEKPPSRRLSNTSHTSFPKMFLPKIKKPIDRVDASRQASVLDCGSAELDSKPSDFLRSRFGWEVLDLFGASPYRGWVPLE